MEAQFTTYVYRGRNEREHELEVTYRATAGTPARLYGDYPHPDEPGDVEIIRVTHDGEDFDTTREEDDIIYEEAVRRAPVEETPFAQRLRLDWEQTEAAIDEAQKRFRETGNVARFRAEMAEIRRAS